MTPRASVVAVACVLLALVGAGCSGGGSVATPAPSVAPASPSPARPSARPSPSAAPATARTPSARPSTGGAPGASGTTTIDWGTIWDTLPAAFPLYPNAHPTVTGGGPASAILDVPADAQTASTWWQTALKGAGYQVVGVNGPREDGSFDITATKGSADCQVEVSLAPLGTTTTATIYLAAACPFS